MPPFPVVGSTVRLDLADLTHGPAIGTVTCTQVIGDDTRHDIRAGRVTHLAVPGRIVRLVLAPPPVDRCAHEPGVTDTQDSTKGIAWSRCGTCLATISRTYVTDGTPWWHPDQPARPWLASSELEAAYDEQARRTAPTLPTRTIGHRVAPYFEPEPATAADIAQWLAELPDLSYPPHERDDLAREMGPEGFGACSVDFGD